MPRKAIASNSSLGKQLIKTKQKKKFNQRRDDEPVGGYKVVSLDSYLWKIFFFVYENNFCL